MSGGENQSLPYRPLLLFWLGIGAVLIALLAWRLNERVHPWEQALTIPGGFDEWEYTGFSTQDSEKWIALSPDQRDFATARPDGGL